MRERGRGGGRRGREAVEGEEVEKVDEDKGVGNRTKRGAGVRGGA